MNTETEIAFQEDVLLLEEVIDLKNLVVYNDDINTFDYVIETLMAVCKHSPEQAEQCTYLIHFKGKCTVKVGAFEELEAMCAAIHDRGISADIV